MDLVDIQRRGVDGGAAAALPPGPVAPPVAVDGIELAGGAGAGLGVEGVGVRLHPLHAVRTCDGELIGVVGAAAGDEALPDAVGDLGHGVGPGVPGIEITHHGDSPGPRRPDAEHITVYSVVGDSVGAHVFVGTDCRPLMKEVLV